MSRLQQNQKRCIPRLKTNSLQHFASKLTPYKIKEFVLTNGRKSAETASE